MKKLIALLLGSIGLLAVAYGQTGTPGCGNGTSSPSSSGNQQGSNKQISDDPFVASSGNDHRDILDLKFWAAAGQSPLEWRRYSNSRLGEGNLWFGEGSNWRHSYQWEMADVGSDRIMVSHPDGMVTRFQRFNDTEYRTYQLEVPYVVTISGNIWSLKTPDKFRYNFEMTTQTVYPFRKQYKFVSFADALGNTYSVTSDASGRISRITEPGGRYLQLSYQALPIVTTAMKTLHQPNGSQVAGWNEVIVNDTATYRYVAYFGPYSGKCNIGEIEFYERGTGARLTGTPIYGSYPDADNPLGNALDGNTSTYSQSQRDDAFVGLDFGVGRQIGKIRFFPRDGFLARVTNGKFIAMNSKPATVPVISQVAASDGRVVTYTYSDWQDDTLPYIRKVLTGVAYEDGAQASYTYMKVFDNARPLLEDSVDPRYERPFTKLRVDYWKGNAPVLGMIRYQKEPATGTVLAELSGGPNMALITYEGGKKETLYFDNNARLTRRLDSYNNTTKYEYDPTLGFWNKITDRLGRVTTRTVDVFENPLQINHPDGTQESWTRDDAGRPLTYTDARGKVSTYTYDGAGLLTRLDRPDGTFEQFTYNGFGQVLTHRHANGGVESFAYGPSGLLTSRTNAVGDVTEFAYDALDRVSQITDGRGNTTLFDYNSRGLVTRVTHPDGATREYTYDDFGNQISVTDEKGKTSLAVYDDYRRPIATTDALGRTTTTDYVNAFYLRPSRVELPSGKQIRATYDLELRKISETTGYGTSEASTTSYAYDKEGNLLKITDGRGKHTTFVYDVRNRRVKATSPLNHSQEWTYDGNGNVLTEKRPDGGVTTTAYDHLNRPISVTGPKGQTFSYGYSPTGKLAQLTDSRGHVTRWSYDLADRLTAKIYADDSTETYAYDEAGNLTTFVTPSGKVRDDVFDERNRRILADWSDGTPDASFAYDEVGRMIAATNAHATVAFAYDEAGQLIAESQTLPGQSTRTTTYAYDADGNRATMTYPSGAVVAYAYNARNLLTGVSLDGQAVASFSYNANNQTSARVAGNGLLTTYSYDDASRLLSVVHQNAGSAAETISYVLNSVGNRVAKTTSVGTETYAYDAVDQVTGVAYPGGRLVGYQYDAMGNRLTVSDTAQQTPASYGAANVLNQYPSVDGAGLVYDGAGNLTHDGTTTYSYDAENRLVQITKGTVQVSWTYDPLGRRVTRTSGGVTISRVFSDKSIIEEYDATGSRLALNVWGRNVLEILARSTAAGILYYHQDGLNSVTHLTDSQGQVLERYRYDIFGRPEIRDAGGVALAASAVGNPYLFTGHYYEADSDVYLTHYRGYSTVLGRWLSRDPIGERGDHNLYVYVRNNSGNLVDLYGLVDLNLAEDSARPALDSVERKAGVFTVGVHGGFGDNFNTRLDGKGLQISPEDLAGMLANNPNYKPGTPVELWACHAGRGGDKSPAAKFKKALDKIMGADTRVKAPDNQLSIVWDRSTGRFMSSSVGNGDGKGGTDGSGKWVPF